MALRCYDLNFMTRYSSKPSHASIRDKEKDTLSRGGREVHYICIKYVQSILHFYEDVLVKPSTTYNEYVPTKDIIKN